MRPVAPKFVIAFAVLALAPLLGGDQARAGTITFGTPSVDGPAADEWGEYLTGAWNLADTVATSAVEAVDGVFREDNALGRFLGSVGRTLAALAADRGPQDQLAKAPSWTGTDAQPCWAARPPSAAPPAATAQYYAEARVCLTDPHLDTLLEPPR